MSDYIKRSKINLLDAVPDNEDGDNPFHIYARSNFAREIRRYSEENARDPKGTLFCNNGGHRLCRNSSQLSRIFLLPQRSSVCV